MKNQALFSSKDKNEKLKCCLLQFLFGTLRVKTETKLLSEKNNWPFSQAMPTLSPVGAT